MVPTFVITLREVVEASLIVGIIAAFLVKEGRRDALRQMWAGVAIAVVLCASVGIALDVLGEELPQQKQEGLETIVALTEADTRKLAQGIDGLAERLSQVPAVIIRAENAGG